MTDVPHTANVKSESEPTRRGLSAGDYALIVGVLVLITVVGFALLRNNGQPVSGRAPDFNFITFDGEEMSLRDLRGEVVVLNFWASWCGPCATEAPELRAAWAHYEGRGVQFLGIAYADNGSRSIEFLADYGLSYLNAPDLGTRISEMYAIQGVPETFIIDANGDVAEFIYAGVTFDQLAASIDPLLQEG